MRRTRHNRPRRLKTRKNQRGGGINDLPYTWVERALNTPFYQNYQQYATEPFPEVALTSESIGTVSLEEVAKHLKMLVGPVRTVKEFQMSIQEKRGNQIGQGQDSVFESVTIPWIKEVEMALRSSIPQGQNTEGIFSTTNISLSNTSSSPLLIWSLIVSAPSTADIIPVLGP
jgi:hypothetical protein